MSAVYLAQSNYSTPTFSFWDALNPCTDPMNLYTGSAKPGDGFTCVPNSAILYWTGCDVGNPPNCTAACQDPASIFASPYTLHNCIVLASLGPTKSNGNGSLTLQSQTLSEASVETAAKFSIHLEDPGFSRLADNVNQTISECLQQYCDLGNTCDPLSQACYSYPASIENYIDGPSGYCYTDICSVNDTSNLNPDVGGIGVCDHRSYALL